LLALYESHQILTFEQKSVCYIMLNLEKETVIDVYLISLYSFKI
jgi:hypothetical protein